MAGDRHDFVRRSAALGQAMGRRVAPS